MNTPRTKKPKRFSPIRESKNHPEGSYTGGIENSVFAERMGFLIGYWPRVEETMVEVVRDLLGGSRDMPSRQIFYSLIANSARINFLRAILEEGPLNATKDDFYDKIIDEYELAPVV